MVKPEVDWELCQGCEPCEARLACTVRAIVRLDPGEPVFIEPSRCNNCLKCIPTCPYQAISNGVQ